MKFGLAITSTLIEETNLILQLAERMTFFFNDKNYGNGIKSFTIGVVCVSPLFEQFYKVKKPKFTKGKKELIIEGIPFTIEDNFEYSIKINYENFMNSTSDDRIKLVAKEILNSLWIVEGMKNKIKDFDFEKFETDIGSFLTEITS